MKPQGSVSVVGGKKSVSLQLIGAAVDLLALYESSGKLNNPPIISELCFKLSRAIDTAIANNEVPFISPKLPILLQKIDVWKHDQSVLIPFMMLMMSVKIACENGWFQKKESDNLLSLASEVKRFFSNNEVLQEPCDTPLISNIMSRFYPKLKIKSTLSFIEVKPGYRTVVVDFTVLRGMVAPVHEMIGLIVARVDNINTSSCIITPQKVNILLNGIGVIGRNNTSMEYGPQLPTNVTGVLKYGVNLLQAIGNFDGRYTIAIAVMCVMQSSDSPQLQDYVWPAVSSDESDAEMGSQTSLSCPISKNRMRIPVKGYICKHLQCFDYDNYLEINSRTPNWRCPLCGEPVCCSDIRIDQNVVKVLGEVGEDIVHVIISKDGSWKAVSENFDPFIYSRGKIPVFQTDIQDQNDDLSKENQSFNQNCSPQISATKDNGPSGVKNMHRNASNLSSLAANSTDSSDQRNKLFQNSRIMDAINPSGMSAPMSQMNNFRGSRSLQKGTELRNEPSLSSMHNHSGSQVLHQKDSGTQASLTAQNIQPSVLFPCSGHIRTASEQRKNMHEENDRLSNNKE